MRSPIAAVVLAAAVLRVAAVLWIPTEPVSDFWSYMLPAENLLAGRGYVWESGAPTAYLAPGYPLLLAGSFAIAGTSLAVAKAVGVLLSTATVALGGLAARALLGAGAGLLTAVVLALDPRQLLLAGVVASEHLGAPALFAFLWLVARSWRRPHALAAALVAGLVLGVSALARPVGLAACALWPVCAVVAGKEARRVATETVLVFAGLAVVLLPWGVRNARALDRFTVSTTTAGANLFMGNNDATTGTWTDWRGQLERLRPDLAGAPEGTVDRAAAEEARRWIAAHPLEAARLYLRKLAMYAYAIPPTSVAHWSIYATDGSPPSPAVAVLPEPHFLKDRPGLVIGVLEVRYWLLIALAGAGAAVLVRDAWRTRDRLAAAAAVALVGLAAYFPLTTSLFIVVDRYRWPMEDVLTILAGLALATMAGLRAADRRAGGGAPARRDTAATCAGSPSRERGNGRSPGRRSTGRPRRG